MSIYKLVIIGSGPAGWTAAIYAARAKLEPVVYTGIPKQDPGPVLPGGQLMLTTDVENYPGFLHGVSGPDLMETFQNQAKRFGTKVFQQDVVRCDFSRRPYTLHLADGKEAKAHSVVIATGATANWLNLPNELRLATTGGGVSACAVCDGALPVFRGKPLAVIGGGDTAMEEATYLTKFASEVYIVHRRDSLRASRIMQERYLSRPNAKVIWNKVVLDVLGGDFITSLLLEDTVTKERSELAVGGLFVAIGHTPATKLLAGSGIELDSAGYVNLRTRSSATNIEGVFAAGDVADAHYRQAVTAAGMGCQAALEAERWLATQPGLE
ncbi:MAG: thioredoxin-disulfide reductase [Phycisphaerales bacterium]|nr:thioredoxin-disulfide reductase [Phycisphaerales bacterium]